MRNTHYDYLVRKLKAEEEVLAPETSVTLPEDLKEGKRIKEKYKNRIKKNKWFKRYNK